MPPSSQEALTEHFATPHFAAFGAALGEANLLEMDVHRYIGPEMADLLRCGTGLRPGGAIHLSPNAGKRTVAVGIGPPSGTMITEEVAAAFGLGEPVARDDRGGEGPGRLQRRLSARHH